MQIGGCDPDNPSEFPAAHARQLLQGLAGAKEELQLALDCGMFVCGNALVSPRITVLNPAAAAGHNRTCDLACRSVTAAGPALLQAAPEDVHTLACPIPAVR